MRRSGEAPAGARRVEATLGVRGLRPVVSGLRALGHDPAPLLAAVSLDEEILADPDARVPARVVMEMLAAGVERTGDADLGLHLALAAPLADFELHAYAMRSSATLGAALERLCRYQRLIHDTASVSLERVGDCAVLRHALPGGLAIPRHSAEFVVAAWVRVARVITGVADWAPDEAHFAHSAPGDQSELARFFHCRLRFAAGENAIRFAATELARASVAPDAALLEILERHAGSLLDRIPRAASLADRVRRSLAERLPDGEARAASVAAGLSMSVRTLHRTLAAEGTTFSQILDQYRHERAVQALADERIGIAEIAFALGFSELSSFYRAFRRWTGCTPAEYRARAV